MPARVHVLLGPPGYPVRVRRAIDCFKSMTVVHHEQGVKVGDGMVVGRSVEQATTYVVTSNIRKQVTTWEATLERCDFVAVAGEVFYRDQQGVSPAGPRPSSPAARPSRVPRLGPPGDGR